MKTKNKHGRKGVRKRTGPHMSRGVLVQRHTVDTTRPEYGAGYERGWKQGFLVAETEAEEFLELLATKRSAKDIKGLIDKRLQRG